VAYSGYLQQEGRLPELKDEHPIGDWMNARWRDVQRLGDNAERAGRQMWAAATKTGQPVAAPTTSAVRDLGAQAIRGNPNNEPVAIQRGSSGVLKDDEIAAIIFNETRSLTGAGIADARRNLAHAIMNGDEALGAKRPKSAPTTASVAPGEHEAYAGSLSAVGEARAHRAEGKDPTNGARHFNFRGGASKQPFQGYPLHTQAGPLNNSWPSRDLPAAGVYADTYQD
jgi:hypothetical protein